MKKFLSVTLSVLMMVSVIATMPFAVAQNDTPAPETVQGTDSSVDFAAAAPIATVRIDTEKINRENAVITYRDNSKRFDMNEQGYVYAENCTVKQGAYTGLGGFTLSFADAAVFPDGSRKPLEVFFGEVHTIGRTDVAQYTDDLYFAQITDNPARPLDFTPLSAQQKHVAIRSRVYFSIPQAGAEDTFLFAASGINTSRFGNSNFEKIVDAGGHYNYSESMEPMSGLAAGSDLYYPADTELDVVQGTTAGSLGVRFVGAGGSVENLLTYKTGFAAVGNAKTGFSSRIWSSCGTNTMPLQINLLTPGVGYELTTAAGENGSISLWADGTANSQSAAQLAGGTEQTPLTYLVPKGKAVTAVITPDTGYELDTLTVNGTAVQPTRSGGICGPYEYDIPADIAAQLEGDNCTVSATFKTFEKRTMAMTVITSDWTYGEDSSMCLRVSPASIPAFATVTKLYKVRGADDSAYTTEKPTQAGKYTVKFIRSETDMYKEDVQVFDFTIYQANPTYTVPTGLTATYADTLSSVALPEGWQWDDGTQLVGNVGENSFAATFTPADARNYKTASENLTVNVAKKALTVTAEDKSSFCGAPLEALTYTVSEEPVPGDELGITLATLADKDTLGSYDITVNYIDNPNYDITTVNGTYRVEEAPVYDFMIGADAQWTHGSDESLDFTLQRSYNDEDTFSRFRGIEVDGVAVDGTDYDATPGSVNIRLKAAFLNTLAVGEHTLKVLFDDGEVETSVTVLAAQDPTLEPQNEDLPADEQTPGTADTSAQAAQTVSQTSSTSPGTGDRGTAAALTLLISAGVAMTAAILCDIKKRHSNRSQSMR